MKSIAERPIAILSAPGSRGDVNPMVAIGSELKRNGCDVVISLTENYAHVAEAAGLQVEVIFTKAEFDGLLNDPNFWKPFYGARAVLQNAAGKFLEPHLRVIQRHQRPHRTVLVAHPLDFASRIYRDYHPATPLVSIQLSPAIIRNAQHPPRLSSWWFEPKWPAWWVKMAYAITDYTIADRMLSPSVNTARHRLGLPHVSRIMDRWWLSPDLVLGMYPGWFGALRPDCDGDWRPCGFPLSTLEPPLSNKTTLNGAVFVTPGTAHRHARDLFLNTIAACEMMGRPCIVATSYPEQLPESLPNHVISMGYAALDPLLKSCAAIVHHGGIGTTSMAIATACPQLVCPLAFDQFHNADRVQELGVGFQCGRHVWKHNKSSVNALAESLRRLIDSTDVQHRCQQFAARQDSYCGAVVAAKAICEWLPAHT